MCGKSNELTTPRITALRQILIKVKFGIIQPISVKFSPYIYAEKCKNIYK